MPVNCCKKKRYCLLICGSILFILFQRMKEKPKPKVSMPGSCLEISGLPLVVVQGLRGSSHSVCDVGQDGNKGHTPDTARGHAFLSEFGAILILKTCTGTLSFSHYQECPLAVSGACPLFPSWPTSHTPCGDPHNPRTTTEGSPKISSVVRVALEDFFLP